MDVSARALLTDSQITEAKDRQRTRSVEVTPRRDVVHDTADREEDAPTLAPIERRKRVRGIRLEEQRRGVRPRHPRVALLELGGRLRGRRRRGVDDTLHAVENVEQQGGVDGQREVEGHPVRWGEPARLEGDEDKVVVVRE